MRASEVLSHPLVVWAAWLRVDEWYRSGNLAPQPELCHWRIQPEVEVRQLAAELRSGEWQPDSWPQLPYPKRGACLRHYVMPTVKDQVAFMAYLVLLGPLFDNQFYPFVFGNRLYRPLVWNTRGVSRWEQRAYPLLNRHTYLPYARSHGLFRRVASWTVSRMTKAVLPKEDYAGRVHRPDDYDSGSLPPWVQEAWWQDGSSGPSDRAYWASLDIQLAYPSVRLADLLRGLLDLANTPCVAVRSLSDISEITLSTTLLDQTLDGYPYVLLESLADRSLREELAKGLVTALERVTVHESGIPSGAWKPHHARATLPPDNRGLPTGLAISGFLLNVVLHRADKEAHEYLGARLGDDRGAVVRFADDMYVLSRSPEGLFKLIDVMWGAVEANTGDNPIKRKSKSNLYVNLSKVRPPAVHRVVSECLRARGWKRCEEDACDELSPSACSKPASLARWWQDNAARLQEDVARVSVGPRDVGPFVTTLVERLSAIGSDTLGDRFGQGARDRQIQLHDLARFDIADEQVRADTRRAFAANRLAGAWLSKDRGQAHHELVEIRRSVAKVVRETPWKFSLWGAVVRTAARRVTNHRDEDDFESRQWLSSLLACVSKVERGDSWLKDWPEESAESPHQSSTLWRRHYLSFHRAAFWRALADVVGRLYTHEEMQQDRQRRNGPSPQSWATRAVPEGLHGHVAGVLAEVDSWTTILYGDVLDAEHVPHWELDQLVTACLAATPRSTLAEAWRRCKLPSQDLGQVAVPDGVLTNAPATSALLKTNGRVVAATSKRRGVLGRSAIAQLLLSSRNRGIGEVLFPKEQKRRLRGADGDPAYSLAVARQYNCKDRASEEVVRAALRQAKARLRDDPLVLREYEHARSVFLGLGLSWPESVVAVTLHRLLWGVAKTGHVKNWAMRAYELPAIGLPVRVAAALLLSAQGKRPPNGWCPSDGPLVWCLNNRRRLLSAGRQLQLGYRNDLRRRRKPRRERSPHVTQAQALGGAAPSRLLHALCRRCRGSRRELCPLLRCSPLPDRFGRWGAYTRLAIPHGAGRCAVRGQVGMAITDSPRRGDVESTR